MRNYKKYIIIFLFTIIFWTCPVAIAKTLNFSCIEGTPDIEISRLVLAAAYDRLGINITIQELPGLRALLYANEGSTDGELFRAEGLEAQYPNLIRIKTPINFVDVVVITNGIDFKVTNWESIKPYKIGIQSGITFIESNISQIEGFKVYRVKSSSQLLQLLETKRVDAVVAPRISAIVAIADSMLKTITILEPPLQRLPLFHYLHKKHQSLAPILEDVLQNMEDAGETQRIRDEYILSITSE
jgi:polar amino acid transport system substrate-binding protein